MKATVIEILWTVVAVLIAMYVWNKVIPASFKA